MKKLLIILLISTCVSIQAQQGYKYNQYRKQARTETIQMIGVQVGSIVLRAAGDALLDRGRYGVSQNYMVWGHTLKGVGLATAIVGIPWALYEPGMDKRSYMTKVVVSSGSYLFFNLALFNPVYNVVRGNPFGYSGTTDAYDRLWNKMKVEPQGVAIFNGLALVMGVAIQIRYNY